jgi:glycosyltransferase involved in cell wall biosynthesis
MSIAITTDWLVTKGGAERVLSEFFTLWPAAPVFTTVYNPKTFTGLHKPLQTSIHPSSLQILYTLTRNHRILLPLMPRAVESWDLRGFEVILSSSHAVAKGCIPPSSARHICYCHTPMRYAWEMEETYLDDFRLWGPLRALAKRELRKLREWDLAASKRVDTFIANSNEVAGRIERIYGRESVVLHPPVGDRFLEHCTASFESAQLRHAEEHRSAAEVRLEARVAGHPQDDSDYYLSVGRLVPYKRFDLVIEAANRAKFPLKIVGEGPERSRLERLAGDTVEVLGHIPEEELPALYANASATIFPVHEDAGIVPLESQACGTPVIAYGKGGVLDTVVAHGGAGQRPLQATGLFFREQTTDSLLEAIATFEKTIFDREAIREHAKKFSNAQFREKLRKIVMQ